MVTVRHPEIDTFVDRRFLLLTSLMLLTAKTIGNGANMIAGTVILRNIKATPGSGQRYFGSVSGTIFVWPDHLELRSSSPAECEC